jgi:malate dehydrogenase (oxaloacetate-decarboxylating)(NADP+)
VVGFPYKCRGARDVRATEINEEMKMAATRALAALAKENVPDSVAALYGLRNVHFGADYLIPFPFDPRVLLSVAPAVAWAAVASGVATEFIDLEGYRDRLEARLGRARGLVRGLINRANRDPKRIVFPEGDEPKIIRAAAQLVEEGIAQPILLGDESKIRDIAALHRVPLDGIALEDPAISPKRDEYAHYMWQLRQRKGLSLDEARRQLYNGNYFGSCMIARGDADALLSGVNLHYPETIRPALQVIGAHPGAKIVSGMYMLVTDRHVVFCADTTVNLNPTAEQLAQIGMAACRVARTMGVTPRVAMLSFSNFGSVRDPEAQKMADAARLLREREPSIVVDGEMQADTALSPEILGRDYPFSLLKEEANVLVFPNLAAGNIAYKMLHHLGGATAIGPILLGMRRPVHILERGADVQDIVNMAAVAVVDAQDRSRQSEPLFAAIPAPAPGTPAAAALSRA